jgi:hypothetical protein
MASNPKSASARSTICPDANRPSTAATMATPRPAGGPDL